jgi:hypothetical protein
MQDTHQTRAGYEPRGMQQRDADRCVATSNLLQVDGDATLVVFVFFIFWDYVPTVLLLSTISSGSMGNSVHFQRNA